jgi:hypothetical protein
MPRLRKPPKLSKKATERFKQRAESIEKEVRKSLNNKDCVKVNKFLEIYPDKDVAEYIEEMSKWIVNNSDGKYSKDEIDNLFLNNKDLIRELFEPYPETITGEDVGKWAELLAVRWGILDEPEIEFL